MGKKQLYQGLVLDERRSETRGWAFLQWNCEEADEWERSDEKRTAVNKICVVEAVADKEEVNHEKMIDLIILLCL